MRQRKILEKLKYSYHDDRNCIVPGNKVMALWTEKDLKGTEFEPGWYEGEIQWHNDSEDTVRILHREDARKGKTAVYELCVTAAIADGILKL